MSQSRCSFPYSVFSMIIIVMIFVFIIESNLPLLHPTTTTTTTYEVAVDDDKYNKTIIEDLQSDVNILKDKVMKLTEELESTQKENQKMKTEIDITTTTISSIQSALFNNSITAGGDEIQTQNDVNKESQNDAIKDVGLIFNSAITAEEDKIQTTVLQKLKYDTYYPDSAWPYIGADIWDEVVDHNHSFYFRTYDWNFPNTVETIREWIASKPRPISIVMNNQKDLPWPYVRDEDNGFDALLAEPNLHRLYISNPHERDTSDKNSKVKPLPVGLQFNIGGKSTLYSEAKEPFLDVYSKISKSPSESKALFLSPNRTNTVYLRPMGDTNHMSNFYNRSNDALKTWRSNIYAIINETAPKSSYINMEYMDRKDYMDQLLVHRFVLSPAGNGIDCHGTWEALLAGCIPIVPISPLIPMFENLPVWLVSSWDEVTDDILEEKAEEFLSKIDEYNFEKVFSDWWKHEINNVGW